MTSLIAWLAVDHRRPSSIYLASDSRFSWHDQSGSLVGTWDYGKKVFAAHTQPDLFGYCGNVLFPSLLLSQIVEHIDAGVFFPAGAPYETKRDKVLDAIQRAFTQYPRREEVFGSAILYCTRIGERETALFHASIMTCNRSGGWDATDLQLPTKHSNIIHAVGSGATVVEKLNKKWQDTLVEKTKGSGVPALENTETNSRYVFGAFCHALDEGTDKQSGGPAQLVGLYRKDPGMNFGVTTQNKRYLHGLEVNEMVPGRIEWRDDILQRTDPVTLTRQAKAQPHARPKGI